MHLQVPSLRSGLRVDILGDSFTAEEIEEIRGAMKADESEFVEFKP